MSTAAVAGERGGPSGAIGTDLAVRTSGLTRRFGRQLVVSRVSSLSPSWLRWPAMKDLAARPLLTDRLVLEPMSVELMQLVVAADWPEVERVLGAPFPQQWRQDGWHWLQPRIVEGEDDPALLVWGTRIARRRDVGGRAHGPVIAEAGFHGPPDSDGWVEIGYRVAVEHQRQGYAEEAARALIAWAVGHGVAGVCASVRPDNAPSLALVHKLGYVEDGTFIHEHLGELLRFRPAAPTSGG